VSRPMFPALLRLHPKLDGSLWHAYSRKWQLRGSQQQEAGRRFVRLPAMGIARGDGSLRGSAYRSRRDNRRTAGALPLDCPAGGLSMRISIDITGADERTLTEAAERFNVPADELAAAALSDFLTLRDEEFERAAQRVLAKHRELYRRLA
jgi:hypothetical protein